MPPKKEKKKPSLVWKQGDGWIQYDPHPHHPCYEEWMLKREKHEQEKQS